MRKNFQTQKNAWNENKHLIQGEIWRLRKKKYTICINAIAGLWTSMTSGKLIEKFASRRICIVFIAPVSHTSDTSKSTRRTICYPTKG